MRMPTHRKAVCGLLCMGSMERFFFIHFTLHIAPRMHPRASEPCRSPESPDIAHLNNARYVANRLCVSLLSSLSKHVFWYFLQHRPDPEHESYQRYECSAQDLTVALKRPEAHTAQCGR